MEFFPFYMDVSDKSFLIVGGGRIALHKAEVLLQFNTRIYVVAPQICEDMYSLKYALKNSDNFNISKREFCEEDILNSDIVIAATNQPLLNSYIAKLCKKNNKLVNVVDVQKESGFIFPAMIKKKDFLLTISTGGKSPMFAVNIKEELQESIPDYYGDIIDMLGEYREYMKQSVPDGKLRNKIYRSLIARGKEAKGKLEKKEIEDMIEYMLSDV